MMKRQAINRLLVVAMCLIIAGCATIPPLMHDVQTTAVFDAKSEVITNSVKEFFNKEKMPVKKESKDPGLVETEEIKVPYEGFEYVSDYCDCGAPGGLYVYHDILGKFNALISGSDNGKTSLQISAAYRASLWWNDTFIGWVACQSKGYIESKMIGHLNASLKKGKK